MDCIRDATAHYSLFKYGQSFVELLELFSESNEFTFGKSSYHLGMGKNGR
jgi:hypothetical protein